MIGGVKCQKNFKNSLKTALKNNPILCFSLTMISES